MMQDERKRTENTRLEHERTEAHGSATGLEDDAWAGGGSREARGVLAAERRNRVLQEVRNRGQVQVNELAQELGVSAMTVRRDLAWLEQAGLIRRIHGGAVDPRLMAQEVPLRRKSSQNRDEKRAVGRLAASLVEAGETIILDAGSTVLEAARALDVRPLTVVTNDLVTALELADRPGLSLYVTGGQVRPQVYSLQGAPASGFLEGIRVHLAFLGADGIDPEQGIFTTNLEKVAVKRAMIQAARRTYVLADATKLGTRGFARVAAAHEVAGIVTTDRAPARVVSALRELGLEVLLASTDPRGGGDGR